MGAKPVLRLLATAGIVTSLATGSTIAQDAPPQGVSLTLDVSNTVRAHSNIGLSAADPGATYRASTILGLGLLSETRTQRLSFNLGGSLRLEDDPSGGTTAGFENPSVALSYRRELANSLFTVDAFARQIDTDSSFEAFDPDLGTASLITEAGTRTTYRFGSELAVGTAGPLTVTLGASTSGSEFEDTTNPDLFDRRTDTIRLNADLILSPVLTGQTGLTFSQYTAEDITQTTRDSTAVSFGLLYAADPRTNIGFRLGARRIDDSVAGLSEAVEGGLTFARSVNDGVVLLNLSSELTTAGRQTSLALGRSLDLPGAALEFTVGLTEIASVSVTPTFSLSYNREMARGVLSSQLSSDISVDSDAQIQQVITGAVDYTHFLDARSQLSVGISFLDVNDVASIGLDERQRRTISATYNRELTRDWDLSVGLARVYSDSGTASAQDSSVFFSFDRSFTLLP